jgi:hypothetical protein
VRIFGKNENVVPVIEPRIFQPVAQSVKIILRYTVKPLDVFKACSTLVTNPNGTILSRTRQCVAYADNVLTLGRWVRAIEVLYDMIYLLIAIGLTPGGSTTVHIYTQTIRRTTKKNKQYIEPNTKM